MSANFTPEMLGYTGQGPFRYWCQKVLPLVYDDSLSYLEVLHKVTNYLNNTISDVANMETNVDNLAIAFNNLQGYVNEHIDAVESDVAAFEEYVTTYLTNLDVQDEINTKLDAMATSGALGDLILGEIYDPNDPDNSLISEVVSDWLNNAITGPAPGEAVIVDGTLSISGAAADAKVTGDNVNELKSALKYLNDYSNLNIKINSYGIERYYSALSVLQNDPNVDINKVYIATVSSAQNNRLMWHNGTAWEYFYDLRIADYQENANDIVVAGLGRVLTSGKNLFAAKFVPYTNFEPNGDFIGPSSVYKNTTAEREYIPVSANTTYTYSDSSAKTNLYIFQYTDRFVFIKSTPFEGATSATFTTENNTAYVRVKLYLSNGTESIAKAENVQLELGSEVTSYEKPYSFTFDTHHFIINDEIQDGSINDAKIKSVAVTNNIRDILDAKRNAIIERNGSTKFLNVGVCTDTHVSGNDTTGMLDVEVLNQLGKENWIDCVVHTGDVFNAYDTGHNGNGITLNAALQRIDDTMIGFNECKMPVCVVPGNHDGNNKYKPNYPDGSVDTTQRVTKEMFYLLMQSRFAQGFESRYACSFYKDFDNEKVRAIFFDSFPAGDESIAVTHETLSFLADALTLGEKSDYAVIFFTHAIRGNAQMINILNAFKAGSTFNNSTYNVHIDFSAQGQGDLIGAIVGHEHGETESNESGFWILSSNTSYLKTDADMAGNVYATVYTFDTINKFIYKQKLGSNGYNKAYNWSTLTSEDIS